jgi:hypothetical protein
LIVKSLPLADRQHFLTNMPSQTNTSPDPPPLVAGADGVPERSSIADIVEWFLNFDERTARIRHPQTEELFRWKQNDDAAAGITTYPFENAEARFAIGVFQALDENNSEPLLKLWITDVLNALGQAREMKTEITEAYSLDKQLMDSALVRSEKLTTNAERRAYLSSCWHEALFTAEARVLGWIYQEMYGRPFST